MKNALWAFCIGSVLMTPLLLAAAYVGNAIAEQNRIEYRLTKIEHTTGINQ